MTDFILNNKTLFYFCVLIVLNIAIILILIYKKVTINVSQQNYPPPPKEENKTYSIYQVILNTLNLIIVAPVKIIVQAGIISALFLTLLKLFGIGPGVWDLVNKISCGNGKKLKIICVEQKRPRDLDENYYYDTNPQNNAYIKGSLTKEQLEILDYILEYEKEKCGLRLSWLDLRTLTIGDQKLADAYIRWRKCKDLMRSSGRVIYPSERALYCYNKQ